MSVATICWCGEELEWEGSCRECQRLAHPTHDADLADEWMPGDPLAPTEPAADDLELPLAPLVAWIARRGLEVANGEVEGDTGISTLARQLAARYGTKPLSEDRRIQRLLQAHRQGTATVMLSRAERLVMGLDWHPGFIWGDLYRNPRYGARPEGASK